jgi:putative Holliday junction resolvase
MGIDFGRRRIGLAISDPSGTLARPLLTLTVTNAGEAIDRVSAEIVRLMATDDGLSEVVVGVPVGLDGAPTDSTAGARVFVDALRRCVPVPVVEAEERLTSREAESRLAVRERDWRKRKEKLDAAAAAIILQDYLDQRGRAVYDAQAATDDMS